jgi:FkbM family methyltransferase
MLTKRDWKIWLRSGSYRFMQDSRGAPSTALATYRWNGHDVSYRPGTSDCSILYDVLLKRGRKGEYWLPDGLTPKTIYDIGGNIGITSLHLARLYPDARIHVFEPMPANLEVLRRNVAPYPRITVHPVALGAQDCELEIFFSDDARNFGGFSFFEKGVDRSKRTTVPVRQAQAYLDEQGIDAPDLIKIDTEGSEYPILTALRPAVVAHAQWIMGELHDRQDFELLAYLSKWFDIGARKSLGKRLFMFNACNKSLAGRVRT